MPNHFHLLVRGHGPGAMSAFVQSWLTSHVRRFHLQHGTSGHLWDNRHKRVLVQENDHFLTALQYIALNPVRAGLVRDPYEWRYGSLRYPSMVSALPIDPPGGMRAFLARGVDRVELERLRKSVQKMIPYGTPEWSKEMQEKYGPPQAQRRGRTPIYAPATKLKVG